MRMRMCVQVTMLLAILSLALQSTTQAQDLYLNGGCLNGAWRFDGKTGLAKPSSGQGGAVFVPNNSVAGYFNPIDLIPGCGGSILTIGALNAVYEFDASTGQFLGELVPNNAEGIANLSAIGMGEDCSLYVLGGAINGIWRFDGETGQAKPAAGQSGAVFVPNNSVPGFFNTVDLAVGSEECIYAIGATNEVFKFDGTTGAFLGTPVSNSEAGVENFRAITSDSNGNIFLIGETQGGQGFNGVWRFDAGGDPLPGPGLSGAVFVSDALANALGLAPPLDIHIGPNGNLFAMSSNAVLEFDSETGAFVSTYVPAGTAGICGLAALTFTLSPWNDMGGSLAGTLGVPDLAGCGTLDSGATVELVLTNANLFSTASLVIGVSELCAPFKGGKMVPSVDLVLPAPTGAGTIALMSMWPPNLPTGLNFYFQYWIEDPAGPKGFAASNALSITTP